MGYTKITVTIADDRHGFEDEVPSLGFWQVHDLEKPLCYALMAVLFLLVGIAFWWFHLTIMNSLQMPVFTELEPRR